MYQSLLNQGYAFQITLCLLSPPAYYVKWKEKCLGKCLICSHIFLILICQSSGNNDIRQMTEFSPQLDMLIEKPNFRGKVHVCADGRTMPDGRPRSVSIPNRTLMAHFSAFSTSAGPCGVYKLGKSVSVFFSALDSGALISCREDAPMCDNKKRGICA